MPNILVVDDSHVDQRLIGGILSRIDDVSLDFVDDGVAAIGSIKQSLPDLVLTDLQMPKMDGLQLVQAVGLHFAGTPVVLMTGRGSEEIAVEALAQGAASYISKARLNEQLIGTVTSVLARSRAYRSHERLIRCSALAEFTFELDNDPTLIDPLVELVQQIALSMGVCDKRSRLQVGVALEQAISNAMYHGNLELNAEQARACREEMGEKGRCELVERRASQAPYRDRKTHVNARIRRDEARLVIRDAGSGFDISQVPEKADPGQLAAETGRGLVLMRAFMDEVQFNDQGNEVTLVKRRTDHAAERPPVPGG